jgi:hypothetical protein
LTLRLSIFSPPFGLTLDQLFEMLSHHMDPPLTLNFCGEIINDWHYLVFAKVLVSFRFLIFLFLLLQLGNVSRKGTIYSWIITISFQLIFLVFQFSFYYSALWLPQKRENLILKRWSVFLDIVGWATLFGGLFSSSFLRELLVRRLALHPRIFNYIRY